ncbi:protein PHLOEM PROTEIN 2-LIKE A9-like [Argentina anserina]|uniref:protein PHLOEM PROTEIN 2-LIKE A9-like n=1 Tax=Argentina anserina TaxID=57926 RepID=UPI0021767D56|nr:protein PHLOEM PROTEIN 2-LIKE A9-like [Potentilla anserina]
MSMTRPHFQAEKDTDAVQKNGDNFVIKPRGLSIVWGKDESYWKIPAKGTDDAAELMQVSWLEVTGSVKLTAGNSYNLTFEVELLSDAFGWKDIQVFLMARVGKKGKYNWKKVQLQPAAGKEKIPKDDDKLTIAVPTEETDTTLQFGLYEVWSGKWKGGLKIYNAEVTVIPDPDHNLQSLHIA